MEVVELGLRGSDTQEVWKRVKLGHHMARGYEEVVRERRENEAESRGEM